MDEFSASPTALAAPFPVRQPPLVASFHIALVVKRTNPNGARSVCEPFPLCHSVMLLDTLLGTGSNLM